MERRDRRPAPGAGGQADGARRRPLPADTGAPAPAGRSRLRLASSRPARPEGAPAPTMRRAPGEASPRPSAGAPHGRRPADAARRPAARAEDAPRPGRDRRRREDDPRPRLNNTFRAGSAAAGGNTLRSAHSADGLRRPDRPVRGAGSVIGQPLRHERRGMRGPRPAYGRPRGRYVGRPARPRLPFALRSALAVLLAGAVSAFAFHGTAGLDPAVEGPRLEVAPLNQAELTLSTPIADWRRGEFPHLYQTDPAWSSRPYGGGTVALNACGPTVMSMLYVYYTGDTGLDPASMAAWADERVYAPTGATEWSFFTEGAERLGLSAKMINPDRSVVSDALREGRPVVCVVGPGDFTDGGHYILLTGIDGAGNVSVCDPNSPRTSARRWDLTRVLHQTEVAWEFGV